MQWRRVESAARVLVTVGVAAVGMAAGFTHTHDAAVRAGQEGWLAWADAVVIELMVLVAGWQIHHRRQHGGSVGFPVTVLVIAFGVQMGAQVSGAPATVDGWLFAALPAAGALVIIKMSMSSAPAEDVPPAPIEVSRVHADAVRESDEYVQVQEAEPPALEPVASAPVAVSWPPQS